MLSSKPRLRPHHLWLYIPRCERGNSQVGPWWLQSFPAYQQLVPTISLGPHTTRKPRHVIVHLFRTYCSPLCYRSFIYEFVILSVISWIWRFFRVILPPWLHRQLLQATQPSTVCMPTGHLRMSNFANIVLQSKINLLFSNFEAGIIKKGFCSSPPMLKQPNSKNVVSCKISGLFGGLLLFIQSYKCILLDLLWIASWTLWTCVPFWAKQLISVLAFLKMEYLGLLYFPTNQLQPTVVMPSKWGDKNIII